MKTIAAIWGFFGILPGAVWAAIVLAFALHSCGQGHDVERLGRLHAEAKKQLAGRVAAEAVAVAAAVQEARAAERAARAKQERVIDDLHKQNQTAAAELDAAHKRVRNAIYGLALGPSGPGLPTTNALAGRVEDGEGTQFRAASRDFADQLLRLAAEANEVTRERNACIALK